ncbi:MAG TPA: SusC/RagA family TonB-linked outer membrane protein [Gemmatimonadota bacterium]|nr:SusC/RagA family TonB-linked outer membrane protein [Gemmatimonadota bacterium]
MDFVSLWVKRSPVHIPFMVAALALPLLLGLASPDSASAQGAIQGYVTQTGGLPIVGAQVQIVNSDQGAVTDGDGFYRIDGAAAGERSVRVVYLGSREETRTVTVVSGGTAAANFRLTSVPIDADAIVVTGTAGNVQRRSIGNALTDINVEEVLEKAPVTNLADLLQGRAAGAYVLQPSGTAGTGANIRLRGISSITQDNQPLIYVDGVRVDNDATAAGGFTVGGQLPSRLNDIPPEDIESIEIIKGPAAATLYGTEASAGVIQIITKKGRAGETRYNVRASYGTVGLGHQDFPENFAALGPLGGLTPEQRLANIQALNPRGLRVEKTLADGRILLAQNPIENIIQDGSYHDYTASMSGGRDNFSFYASGSYNEEKGPMPANTVNKVGGRANFQWSPSEAFDIAVSSGYTNNDIRLPNNDNNIFGYWGNALLARPDRIRQTATNFFEFGEPFTPVEVVDALESHFTNDRFTGSVVANLNPRSWWRNKATFGVDLNAEENFQFIPFGVIFNLSPQGEKFNHRQTVVSVSFDGNSTVSYDLTNSIRSNTSVGGQILNQNTDIVEAFGENFPAPGVSTVSAAGTTEGFESRSETTTVGVYFQEQIAWQNRLFLTGAVRFDDNSAFGENFDFETYPKVSAAWVISEEPFFNLGFVDQLKLRAAYGFAGKQPAAFSADRDFNPVSIRGGIPTITPGSVGNPELGPERSSELELGFDASVWNDRVGIELTYYDKVTEDALVGKLNIPSLGFPGTQISNIGEVQNSGWELGITGLLLDTDIVDYDVTLTLATNDNEVTSLGGEPGFPFGFEQRIEEGFPVDGYWSRVIIGHTDEGRVILSDDQEFIGRASPDFWGSFGSTVTLWDNLQLYALLDWQRGHLTHNLTYPFRLQFASARERWDPDFIDPIDLANLLTFVGNGEPLPWLETGNFTKLREVSATYTLPIEYASRVGARRVALTVSGRNLKTWTDYSGVDPEINVFGPADFSRSDFLSVPQSRRFIFTVDLSY